MICFRPFVINSSSRSPPPLSRDLHRDRRRAIIDRPPPSTGHHRHRHRQRASATNRPSTAQRHQRAIAATVTANTPSPPTGQCHQRAIDGPAPPMGHRRHRHRQHAVTANGPSLPSPSMVAHRRAATTLGPNPMPKYFALRLYKPLVIKSIQSDVCIVFDGTSGRRSAQLTFPMPSNVLHLHVRHCSIASQRHDPFPQPSADDSYNPLPNPLLSPLTHALLATEAAFLYRFSALRPSGSVLVHPNALNGSGWLLSIDAPSFRPTDSPVQSSAHQ
ncbi:hypothetical protein PAXINDRAFT_13026 [Paxillus involutus ATCC 200175]|uniref:Uncharacterized protein n=1 Tax=Paxillus involutus ATCC 200175 TaxID=664439 RepID=A0A0C9TEU5_PAXIN|nr:hypothetical protein PAXINDRAFT_13026 [Paxillus involutus ATCC 200175]